MRLEYHLCRFLILSVAWFMLQPLLHTSKVFQTICWYLSGHSVYVTRSCLNRVSIKFWRGSILWIYFKFLLKWIHFWWLAFYYQAMTTSSSILGRSTFTYNCRSVRCFNGYHEYFIIRYPQTIPVHHHATMSNVYHDPTRLTSMSQSLASISHSCSYTEAIS